VSSLAVSGKGISSVDVPVASLAAAKYTALKNYYEFQHTRRVTLGGVEVEVAMSCGALVVGWL